MFEMERMPSNMCLTFIYHVPFWVSDGVIWTNYPPIGKYVDSLCPYFKKILIYSPTLEANEKGLFCLKNTNVEIRYVGKQSSAILYYQHLFSFYIRYWQEAKEWDILHIRIPTLTAFPAYLGAKIHGVPIFLVLVGENYAYQSLAGFKGIKLIISNIFARLHDLFIKNMVSTSLTFANGKDLVKKYSKPEKPVIEMRSSTVLNADINDNGDFRDVHNPLKILTVAAVAGRKGTSLLPEIISKLNALGIFVEWTWVGYVDGSAGEEEKQKTIHLAEEYGILPQLHFLDVLSHEELFKKYRQADIFVLPTYMEGIPRVILEAQASGLPVLTTMVGGIPDAVKNMFDAYLVSAGNVDEFVSAIQRLSLDPELRLKLINNGLISAKNFTIEAETKKMIDQVFANLSFPIKPGD